MSNKEKRREKGQGWLLRKRIDELGLLSPERAGVVVSTAMKNQNLPALTELCMNDEVMERLVTVLSKDSSEGGDEDLIYRFLLSVEAVPVLEQFGDEQFWDNFDLGDLGRIGPGLISEDPGSCLAIYIAMSEDDKVGEWLGGEISPGQFLGELGETDSMRALLLSRNRERVMELLGPLRFAVLVKVFPINSVIEYPEICNRLFDFEDELVWSESLVELNRLFYALNMVGFDRGVLEGMMVNEYKRSLARRIAEPHQGALSAVSGELDLLRVSSRGFVDRERFVGAVRVGVASQPELMTRLRENVPRVSSEKWVESWRRRVSRADIAWLESRDNPRRQVVPLIGFEIEFEGTSAAGAAAEMAQRLGFKMGYGDGDNVLEISPGPFADYKTAQLTFLSYLGAGVINTERYYDQSVHLNLGVSGKVGTVALMRWLQLTGLAYNPVFDDQAVSGNYSQTDEYHRLRILRKDKREGHGTYIECKEFSLMLSTDYLRFLRYSQLLGAGLMAWQRVFLRRYPDKDAFGTTGTDVLWGNVFVDESYWEQSLSEKLKLIESSDVSFLDKEVARVYVRSSNLLYAGLSQIGMRDYLTNAVPTAQSARVVEVMQEMFPDVYNRMSHEALRREADKPVQINGRVFPNMVVFAREVANRTARKIDSLVRKEERQMAEALVGAYDKKDMKMLWQVICGYQRFLSLDLLAPEEKKAKLERLVRRYKSIGWV